MMNFFSKVISIIFQPLFIPVYGIVVLLNLDYFHFLQPEFKMMVFLVTVISTCVIPTVFLLVLYKLKYIDTLMIDKKEQRKTIYAVSLISYLFCIFSFYKIFPSMMHWIIVLTICIFLVILFLSIINIYWKISVHAAAAGCFTGGTFFTAFLLSINPFWFFILVIILSGLILSARVQLKAHTISQVCAGYLLGVFFTFAFPFLF